jgi:ribosome-associated toxin RatA of RatAB toxin-antitoxin module
MARSYYSTVIDQSADRIWDLVRDFGSYRQWIPNAECFIEDGKPGDQVGAIRNVSYDGLTIRQQLVAHSDVDRSYSYTAVDPLRFPTVRNFVATQRIIPVVDGDRALVEWYVTFDCPAEEYDHWVERFKTLFAGWLESLRTAVLRPGRQSQYQ